MGRKRVGATKMVSNWERAVSLEPRLAELEREVLALPNPLPRDFDHTDAWNGWGDWAGIKPRLYRLVGWGRGEPVVDETTGQGPRPFTASEIKGVLTELRRVERALSVDERWLRSSEAYDVVVDHLWYALPPCWEEPLAS